MIHPPQKSLPLPVSSEYLAGGRDSFTKSSSALDLNKSLILSQPEKMTHQDETAMPLYIKKQFIERELEIDPAMMHETPGVDISCHSPLDSYYL